MWLLVNSPWVISKGRGLNWLGCWLMDHSLVLWMDVLMARRTAELIKEFYSKSKNQYKLTSFEGMVVGSVVGPAVGRKDGCR